jgi:hypothetical protein
MRKRARIAGQSTFHEKRQEQPMSMTPYEPAGAAEAADDPQDVAARKRFCTWLQYWRDCEAPACRRAHACAGDPTACFLGRWMRFSEAAKIWVGAGISALEQGLSARNAAGAADLALLHHVKMADHLPRHPPRRKRWRLVDDEDHAGAPCTDLGFTRDRNRNAQIGQGRLAVTRAPQHEADRGA